MNKNNRLDFLLINKLNKSERIIEYKSDNKSLSYNKLNTSLNKTRMQGINKSNKFLHQIYQYNNNNSLNNWFKDKIVAQLLEYYFTSSWTSLGAIKIQISKPIFKHTNNKVNVILFIHKYVNPTIKVEANTYNLLNRLIDQLIQTVGSGTKSSKKDGSEVSAMSLSHIVSSIYNKEVEIEPIILKYDYMDSYILSKNVSNNVLKYLTFKGKYYQNMQYNINLIDTYQYMLTYNNYKDIVKNILDDHTLDNRILNTNVIWSLLLNKYISGYSFSYNGKLAKSDSNARTIHYKKINGTLKCTHVGLYTQNIMSNAHNINKNGKNNTKIILNHI